VLIKIRYFEKPVAEKEAIYCLRFGKRRNMPSICRNSTLPTVKDKINFIKELTITYIS